MIRFAFFDRDGVLIYRDPALSAQVNARVREWTGSDDELRGYYADEEERDFGLMLYDMEYADPDEHGIPQRITPLFYRPVMRHGVVDVAGSEVFR